MQRLEVDVCICGRLLSCHLERRALHGPETSRESPGETSQEQKEREQVGKCWVWAVVGGLRLFLGVALVMGRGGGDKGRVYVVVDVTEDLLWRYYEVCHFPYGLCTCNVSHAS